MSKAQKIDKAIGWLTIAGAAYFVGTAIAGAIKRKRETTSGIGDLTAWNKRNLADFFERNMWRDRVVVYIAYEDDRGYIPVDFIYAGHNYAGRSCVVSPNNLDYLKELCRIYNCSYKQVDIFPGYIPNVKRRVW